MTKRIVPLLAALLLFSGLTMLYGQADGDYFDLGKSAYKSKRYQKAYDYFKQAVRLRPDKAKYQYNLGLAARKMKYYDEAFTAFSKARSLDPDMKFTTKHTEFMKKIREMEVKAGGIGDRSPGARKSKPYKDPDITQAVKAGKKKKKGGLPHLVHHPLRGGGTGRAGESPGPEKRRRADGRIRTDHPYTHPPGIRTAEIHGRRLP